MDKKFNIQRSRFNIIFPVPALRKLGIGGGRRTSQIEESSYKLQFERTGALVTN